jgi:hypothetical protein
VFVRSKLSVYSEKKANVHHASPDMCAVGTRQKNLNEVLTVTTLVTNNANEAEVAPGLAESGVTQSVLCWCVWQEFSFSRREYVFTFNLVSKEIL